MRKTGWTFLLVFLSLLGCGSKASAPKTVQVTCEWLAGDNCWKETVARVATCVDQSATCVFSADGSACTYPDGTLVSLAPPRTTSLQFYFAVVDVVIHSQGAECAALHVTPGGGGDSFSLRTSAGTFSQSFSAGAMRYACPDGTIYVMDLSTAINCHLDTKLPGYALYGSSGGGSPCDGIALEGVDTNTVAMFCGTP
jgi:hypothetical protein